MKEHIKRKIEMSKGLMPLNGTKEHEEVVAFLKKRELANPNLKNELKKNFEEARNTAEVQIANSIGIGVDNVLRDYLKEFNTRSWKHGHRSMPAMFNVLEAFYDLNKRINSWILLEEENYKLSFFDFIDYYTSKEFKFELGYFLENFEEDLIYNYHINEDLRKITFKTSYGKEFVIAGLSLVRRGDEVSMLFLTGEITDTKEITENSEPLSVRIKSNNPNKKNIVPDKDLQFEAVKLNDDPDLWRVLIACRLDLESETTDIRYVAKDMGNNFTVVTDDRIMFDIQNKLDEGEYEEFYNNTIKEVEQYDSIWELAKTVLYLPMFFNDNEEIINEEDCKTELGSLIKTPQAKRKYKNVDSKHKIRTRHIWSLDGSGKSFPDMVKLKDENFKIETSGYYKNIEPEEIGTDKMDRPIKGRTWVNRTDSFFKANASELIISKKKKNPFNGENAGKIYIMRNSSLDRDVFKIGLTTKSTEVRAAQLSKTSIPDKFHVMNEWDVRDCRDAEKIIHKILDAYRVDPRREFFKVKMTIANDVIEKVVNEINGIV